MICSSLDCLILTILVAAIIILSLVNSRLDGDYLSFINSRGQTGWLRGGVSIFMSYFSAGTFVVWGSISYSNGLVGITIQETISIAALIVAVFIARKWKETGNLTVSEYLEKRFGKKLKNIYCFLFVLMAVMSAACFLHPISMLLSGFSGLSFSICVIILGFVGILCASFGGMKSVISVDIIKFLIMIIAFAVLVPVSISKAGGLSSIVRSSPEHFFSPVSGEYSWLFLIAFCVYNIAQAGGNWSVVQKFCAMPDGSHARKAGLTFALLYLICPLLWMLPCLAFRTVDGSLDGLAAEGVFMNVCQLALPAGLLGFMMASLIFTSLSSIDALTVSSSSTVANDVVRQLYPEMRERSLLIAARISAVCFSLMVILVTLAIPKMGGLVNTLISLAAIAGVPLYLPAVWSLFSKRQTSGSMLFVTFTSLGVNLFCKFVLPAISAFSLNRAAEMAVGVSIPIILLIICDLYNNKKPYSNY